MIIKYLLLSQRMILNQGHKPYLASATHFSAEGIFDVMMQLASQLPASRSHVDKCMKHTSGTSRSNECTVDVAAPIIGSDFA